MKRLLANNLTPIKLDDNAIQYITDSMANNLLIQIEYEGSGWRTVQPYSFTTSKDNNLLVMCYKGDGSVRSYRFDRIEQLYVDDALLNSDNFEHREDNSPNLSDYEIPYLPEYDEILELSENEEGEPFQEGLDSIEEGQMFEPLPADDEEKNDEGMDNTEEEVYNKEESSSDDEENTEQEDDGEVSEVNDSSDDEVDVDLDQDESEDEVDVDLDEDEQEEE